MQSEAQESFPPAPLVLSRASGPILCICSFSLFSLIHQTAGIKLNLPAQLHIRHPVYIMFYIILIHILGYRIFSQRLMPVIGNYR